MNNSFERLIEGMTNTLRKEVIPHLNGEYARGQAFGVIYMLNSIALRAAWSPDFFRPQLAMLETLNKQLQPMLFSLKAPPLPDVSLSEPASVADLQVCLEKGNERVCGLLDWLSAQQATLPATEYQAIEAAINGYMGSQVAWEIKTTAKPMFAQISKGEE